MKDFIKSKLMEFLSDNLHSETRIPHKMVLPESILLLNNIFKENGFELYVVGGAVRDSLLNIEPKDYDLSTNAKPDTVEGIMEKNKIKTIPTGKQFGVINVFMGEDEFEIATFRSDGEYSDGRRPDSVTFGDIKSDAMRRDLSLNTLFYDIDTGEIVDLVGGIDDLKNGIVRTVGDPADRFGEDRLRIMRAIRFAGRFGSEVDPSVDAALKKDNSLEGVSPERIRDEFLKGIKTAKSVKHFLGLIDKYNLWDDIFPGLNISKDSRVEDKDPIIVIANLLKNNDPTKVSKVLNKLTYSSSENKGITFLVALQQFDSPEKVYKFKKLEGKSGVAPSQILKFSVLADIDGKLIAAFDNFQLSVTGQDVQNELGIKPGPEMGKAIEKLEIDNFRKLL